MSFVRLVTRSSSLAIVLGIACSGCSGTSSPGTTETDSGAVVIDEGVTPDTNTATPDTNTTTPDTDTPDTNTTTPDTDTPDTSAPDASAPDASAPDTSTTPDTKPPIDTGADVKVDTGPSLPPTTLPVECRTKDSMLSTGPAQCIGKDIGTGPNAGQFGSYLFGYYDATSDSFYVNGNRAIVKIARTTGNRTAVSGIVDDPAAGKKTIGTGPVWTEGSLIAIRPKKDGKMFAMGNDGFYVVDPATGNRTKLRDFTGVPTQNSIRVEGRFAVDAAEDFYVAITRKSSGGGVGILKFPNASGAGTVVTLSGAVDTTRNKGTGVSYDVAGYEAVEVFGGKVYMLNFDDDNLMSVEIATGNRLVVSDESRGGVPVGTSTDGYKHYMAGGSLLFDGTKNLAYTGETKIDLTNGNRTYANALMGDIIEAVKPGMGFPKGRIGGSGFHFDTTKQIIYTLYGKAIAAYELPSSNFNYISVSP